MRFRFSVLLLVGAALGCGSVSTAAPDGSAGHDSAAAGVDGGSAGTADTAGTTGAAGGGGGTTGVAGTTGAAGTAGAAGTTGAAGTGGAAGTTGTAGTTGAAGAHDAGVDAPAQCADGTSPPCCPTGETKCGSTCVNLKTSTDSCGSCGNACASDQSCKSGACKGNNGAVCTDDAGCATGKCNFYYRDDDGDTYGADAKKVGFCNVLVTPNGYSVTGGDCCDDGSAANKAQAALIHPGADWQTTKATACNIGWDYNCSGHVDMELPGGSVVLHCSGSGTSCAASYGSPVEADCGVASGSCATDCFTVSNNLCVCGHYDDPKVHCR